ncbi:MAG: hypothetical protein AUG20_00795 [Gemmatimonas sp. 13_1_20CM_3_60_15]|nr:MAG: hypothetical protein AUG20_00795 [Gemmatimonas sp. 13_1_20CM_3_60_15]
MSGIVVATGKERRFIDRRCYDAVDFAGLCHLDGTLDRHAAEFAGTSGVTCATSAFPMANRHINPRG